MRAVDVARIHIHRRRAKWVDRMRAYKVTIDGQEAGRIRNGQTETFQVAPGQHVVQLAVDWARSEPWGVMLAPGQDAYLECHTRNPFTLLYWIVVAADRYIALVPTQGPPTPPRS
jgi:predicted amidohydrolase YtcJ